MDSISKWFVGSSKIITFGRCNINQSKIYACGYSNGAGFSFSIACHLNKIAAIASISGLMGVTVSSGYHVKRSQQKIIKTCR